MPWFNKEDPLVFEDDDTHYWIARIRHPLTNGEMGRIGPCPKDNHEIEIPFITGPDVDATNVLSIALQLDLPSCKFAPHADGRNYQLETVARGNKPFQEWTQEDWSRVLKRTMT